MRIRFISLLVLGNLTFLGAQEGIPLKGKELFGDLKARHIGPAL
jgi:hypothetical protein